MTEKSYRNFTKLHNKYQRKLIHTVKQDCPLFDSYGYGELVYTLMQGQYEYFIKGDNVWQIDKTRLEAADSLAEAMTLFCEAQYIEEEAQFEDNYETYINWRFHGKPVEVVDNASIAKDAQNAKIAFVIYFIKHYNEWWD